MQLIHLFNMGNKPGVLDSCLSFKQHPNASVMWQNRESASSVSGLRCREEVNEALVLEIQDETQLTSTMDQSMQVGMKL